MLVLKISAFGVLIASTPFFILAFLAAIPGMGSPRGVLLFILVVVPVLWIALWVAWLAWIGVSLWISLLALAGIAGLVFFRSFAVHELGRS